MSMYMKIQDYKGNATATNYQDWIELDSLKIGGDRNINMNIGNIASREHGPLNIDALTLTKKMDSASNDLFMAMCNATNLDEVEIHVCQGSNQTTPYAKFVLDKAMVASHHTTVVGDGDLVEEIELGYSKLQRVYIKRNASNKEQSPDRVGYDLAQAQAV